jgi:hypothetical protein
VSKYWVTYQCGHMGQENVFGKETNSYGHTRQERADYRASQRMCINCYKTQSLENSKKEVEEHLDEIEDAVNNTPAVRSFGWLKNLLKQKGII